MSAGFRSQKNIRSQKNMLKEEKLCPTLTKVDHIQNSQWLYSLSLILK